MIKGIICVCFCLSVFATGPATSLWSFHTPFPLENKKDGPEVFPANNPEAHTPLYSHGHIYSLSRIRAFSSVRWAHFEYAGERAAPRYPLHFPEPNYMLYINCCSLVPWQDTPQPGPAQDHLPGVLKNGRLPWRLMPPPAPGDLHYQYLQMQI